MRFLAPKPVQRAVGQNAVKQHRQLVGRFVAVMRGQFHHAVLHDVQSRFFIAHVVQRALEGTLFDAFEEIREFLFGSQEFSGWRGRKRGEALSHWAYFLFDNAQYCYAAVQ